MWKRNTDKEKEKPSKKFTPEYQKPKILLIDLPDIVIYSVRSAGFNSSAGTFGSPYKVKLGDGYQPVIPEYHLPNYTEQDIIIIDLTPPETIDNPEGEKITSEGEKDWWAKCRGEIDPRPRVMVGVKDKFDRILDHGGMFVIFAQPRLYQKLVWAAKGVLGFIADDQEIQADNWSFLSILTHLGIKADSGEELIVPNRDHQLFHFLRKTVILHTATT
jgi:hypothetical protein